MSFRYRYYILAVENITLSYLGSSSRESSSAIAANYVLLNCSRTTYDTYIIDLWSNQTFYL